MNILLPVDGSTHTKKMLSYLAAHDDLLGVRHDYTFLTVVPRLPGRVTSFVDAATVSGYYEEMAENVLKGVRDYAAQQHWKSRTVHVLGHAVEEIAAFAQELKPGLIVMGTHGRSGLGNLVLGSVATGLLATCKFPVLLVQ
jgi:nucleotide-binding universal stress UspA family protein